MAPRREETGARPAVVDEVRVDTHPEAATDEPRPPAGRARPERWRTALLRPVAHFPCWVALAFAWASVFPSLMPRSGLVQGVITAVAVTLGLAVGSLVAWVATMVWRLAGRPVPAVLPYGRQIFAGIAGVITVAGLGAWVTWQNDQREVLGMEPMSQVQLVPFVLVAVGVGLVLFVIGRSVAWLIRRIDRRITRYVPRPLAVAATVVIVVVVSVVVTRDVVATELLDRLNASFGTFDDETPPGVVAPTAPERSGSPASLVPWDTLGYEGRSFAAGGPTLEQLQDFAGPDAEAMEPIRVYAGLKSADGPEAQAALAVEELDRTGAWDRSVLAVVTVTGTGWIDPVSSSSLELLRAGDTAIVGTQYSYLPSWISFLVDLDKAAENARALAAAVTERWAELPEDDRPRLVFFGLSLGSYGSEEVFDRGSLDGSLAAATELPDAVLWAGPTFANPIWRDVVQARPAGTPSWAPEVDGVTLRGTPGEDAIAGALPGNPVVYLTHATDPVTWVNVDSLWSRPDWMADPVGPGVSGPFLWVPGVTLVQEVFDLMAGFSAPPGYGHNYDPNMPDAWVAVAAPDDWTAGRTLALRDAVAALGDDTPVG
ncbi:alpha/beta-hydrolase family protein [Rhabdothermincola salaria]|uniref:alpha/beta-hydrolase family protein n=1 Tax=Rhabdothermincola salaria TaxID=2903142 RepID=UPI001E387593|nr:alpha/beta-hydrolase family protein [Rhabdothermincola salaria]MCD9624848.1 alpha/beta-hydrolase family protein [Rhabdothermincola salaria]